MRCTDGSRLRHSHPGGNRTDRRSRYASSAKPRVFPLTPACAPSSERVSASCCSRPTFLRVRAPLQSAQSHALHAGAFGHTRQHATAGPVS
eukprot:scaffold10064_cov130-Isochrysis_galbana.AAC.3